MVKYYGYFMPSIGGYRMRLKNLIEYKVRVYINFIRNIKEENNGKNNRIYLPWPRPFIKLSRYAQVCLYKWPNCILSVYGGTLALLSLVNLVRVKLKPQKSLWNIWQQWRHMVQKMKSNALDQFFLGESLFKNPFLKKKFSKLWFEF